MSTHRRDLLLTPELLRAYSRRGNFHSDADEALTLTSSMTRLFGRPGQATVRNTR